MRRRVVVAFQEVESPQQRMFRIACTGQLDGEAGKRQRLGYYWCAADRPEGLDVRPVYDGTPVPEDAECRECYIPIRELQEMMR